MKKTCLANSIALLGVCLSIPAFAQENDSAKPPRTSSESASTEVSLAPVTVTANRMDSSAATYAGQVSVLENEDLQGSENVVESLSQIPGFETGYDHGRQIGSQFKIRGFGYQSENRVIIEQDGIRRSVNMFSNHISSFRTDPNLLKEVEVVKGGSSVLHGSGAIGGIVSMRTKDAKDFLAAGKETGLTVGGRYDVNNSRSGYLAFAFDPKNSPFDFVVYGRRAEFGDNKLAAGGVVTTDGERITHAANDENIKNTMLKLGWDITPEQRLSFSYFDYNENLETTWQTLYGVDPGKSPVYGWLKQKDYSLGYQFAPANNPWIDLEAKLYTSKASYSRIWDGLSANRYTNWDERWGLGVKNKSKFKLGAVDNQLVIGLDYEDRNEDAHMVNKGKVSAFGSMPNYYKDLGIYAQNTASFGKLDVTLGARYDSFQRGVDKGGAKGYKDSRLSPKVSLAYQAFDGIYLLAGYAETFRGPTPHETSSDGALNPHYWYVPNANLKPETAKEYEIGFSVDKQNLLGHDELYFKATYFDGKIEDMISLKEAPELGTPPDIGDRVTTRQYAQYRNVSAAKRKGYEVEGKYRWRDWKFGGGYDHLKIIDSATGKLEQPSVDKLSFNASYTHPGLKLTGGVKLTHWFKPKRDIYVRKIRGVEYRYINQAFTIVDLFGSWKPVDSGMSFFDKNFTLNFGINNLFDRKRIHYNSYETTTMVGRGRNYYVSFDKRF